MIINHQEVTANNVNEIEVGRVNNVWFNEEDGWYWCDGVITNQKALDLIDKGWSVSCSYNVSNYSDKGGTENNIKYDMEFLDGNFTHLAIVKNPRYEGADIVVVNSRIDNEEKGRWVTINGTHVFIPDGKQVEDVMKEKGWLTDGKTEKKDTSKERDKDLDFIYKSKKYPQGIVREFVSDKELKKGLEDARPHQYISDELEEVIYERIKDKADGNLSKQNDLLSKAMDEVEGYRNIYKQAKEKAQKSDNSLTNTIAEAMAEVIAENIK